MDNNNKNQYKNYKIWRFIRFVLYVILIIAIIALVVELSKSRAAQPKKKFVPNYNMEPELVPKQVMKPAALENPAYTELEYAPKQAVPISQTSPYTELEMAPEQAVPISQTNPGIIPYTELEMAPKQAIRPAAGSELVPPQLYTGTYEQPISELLPYEIREKIPIFPEFEPPAILPEKPPVNPELFP